MSELVPFGKYKDQPIEALAADRNYVDWVLSQQDLKNRYPDFISVVINNFQEPSETPEHNALQIKFISENYMLKLALLSRKISSNRMNEIVGSIKESVRNYVGKKTFVTHDIDFFDKTKDVRTNEQIEKENKECRMENYSELLGLIKGVEFTIGPVEFEKDGVDVCFFSALDTISEVDISHPDEDVMFRLSRDLKNIEHRIEIKPVVSDDYPAVLRQMRLSNSNILLLSKYTGVGASTEDFIRYFNSQGIQVIFEDEVDKVVVPECLKILF